MMSLEEMEKTQKDVELRKAQNTAQLSMFNSAIKDELEHINWRLVIAIAFGFLMWYAGTAILDNFIHTCAKNVPECLEE